MQIHNYTLGPKTLFLSLACLVFGLFAPASLLAQDQPETVVMVLPFGLHADPQVFQPKEGAQDVLLSALQELGINTHPASKTRELLALEGIRKLDLATARDLAEQAGADYAVYGNINQIGQNLSLDVRLVVASDLQLTQPIYVAGYNLQELQTAVHDLAQKIKDRLLASQRIAEIEVRGNEYLGQDAVLSRLSIQPGDPYDQDKVAQEIKGLFESGFFEDIQVYQEQIPQGQKLVFAVQERPLIREIKFQGVQELKENDILEVMHVQSGEVLNPVLIKQDLTRIQELYRKEGYYRAEVDYRQEEVAQGQVDLYIELEENDKLYIREIEIKGAEELSPKKLKKQLALKERGLFSWITGKGVLQEEFLDRDAAALEAYYANHGFMDAQVAQPQVEYKSDGIHITFHVQEGPRYKVGQVEFSGDLIQDREALLDIVQLDNIAEKDGYFDRSLLREDTQDLADYYTNFGYAFADANADIRRDPEEHVLHVTYRVQKKQKVHIRRLKIIGNYKTRDNVIRRQMLLTEGDQFQGQALTDSKQRLQRLGYFESVDLQAEPTQEPNLMDLRVEVEEKPTGSFSLGAGYSSVDNLFFTGQIQEENFLGKGYTLGFKGSIGSKSALYQLSFWNPHVYDSPLGAGLDAYNTFREYSTYDLARTGGRVKFAYSIGSFTRLHWNYQLEKYTVDNIDEDASDQIKDIEGENWSSSVYLAAIRNTTDRRFAPTQGTKSTVSIEYAGGGLGGDDNFIRTKLEHSYYKSLFWKFIFNWRGQLGHLFENTNESVPDHERFYLGGIHNVRGYEYQDISAYDDEGLEIGGYKSFFNNFELVFPLLEDQGLMGVTFFDAGKVWDKNEDLDFDLYKSIGAGIRWNSPLGPLRLEYGYPLDDLKDNNGRFEFSVGHFF